LIIKSRVTSHGIVTGASEGSNTKQHSIRRTIDIKEEPGANMYRGTLIYAEPSIARRHTNLVCGYNSSIWHMCTASACVRHMRTRTVTGIIF
jgi:hypothetical protein